MKDRVDPNTHRVIQTREGTVTVSRNQPGTPLNQYFKNAELPDNLEKAMVYQTDDGAVLAKPDPVPWNDQHTERASEHAASLKELIDDKGYYRKNLDLYATRLADETGQSPDEVKAIISGEFQSSFGKSPYQYLQEHRQEQGLPTKSDPEKRPSHDVEQS
ncbi:MAG: hypothetical protein ABJN40_07400 [Sneathiella sp.]